MGRKQTTSLRDLVRKLSKDPQFREEHRRQKQHFDLILEIVRARKRIGITQEELASKTGMHQSSISRIESGEYDVRFSSLIQLADGLDCDLDLRFVSRMTDDDIGLVETYLTNEQRTTVFDEFPDEPILEMTLEA